MAKITLKGRALGGGTIEGEAIVSKMMFNWAGAFNPVTTNPAIFMEGVRNKVNPIALVMLEMEPMTMMGVASGAIFYSVQIPAVDHTDLSPIDVIKTGDKVRVNGETGMVEVL